MEVPGDMRELSGWSDGAEARLQRGKEGQANGDVDGTIMGHLSGKFGHPGQEREGIVCF